MTHPSTEDQMHVPHPQRPTRTVAAHTLAWGLVIHSIFVGGGYAWGGNTFATSPSFTILAAIPGGMRTWGILLLAGAVAVAYGIGRDGNGHDRALNVTLSGGVVYYVLWAGMIVAAWVELRAIPAWGALPYTLLMVFLYYLCARAVAPPGLTWADTVLHTTGGLIRRLFRARSPRGRE